MADTQRLITALNAYVGDMDTLNAFVNVAEEELGERWTEVIYQTMGNLDARLKEKLDHAFQYNGAVVAWNEAQGYLEQSEVDVDFISERVPILEHWLAFFGDQGMQLVDQVKQRLQEASARTPAGNTAAGEPVQQMNAVAEEVSETPAEVEQAQPEVEITEEPEPQPETVNAVPMAEPANATEQNIMPGADDVLEPAAVQTLAEEDQKTDEEQEGLADDQETDVLSDTDEIQEADEEPADEEPANEEPESVSLSAKKPVIDESSFVIEEEHPPQEPAAPEQTNNNDFGDLSSLLDEDFLNQPLEKLKEFVRTSGNLEPATAAPVAQPTASVPADETAQPEVENESAQEDEVPEMPAAPSDTTQGQAVPPAFADEDEDEQEEQFSDGDETDEDADVDEDDAGFDEDEDDLDETDVSDADDTDENEAGEEADFQPFDEDEEDTGADDTFDDDEETADSEPVDDTSGDHAPVVKTVPAAAVSHALIEDEDEDDAEIEGKEQDAAWRVRKIKREIKFLDNLEAWISARCVSLGGIELFSYKYYGFLADVSYVLAEDIKAVLADEKAVQILQEEGNDVLKEIQDKQISLESFVQEVKTKLGSDPIPLLNEEVTALEMKKALGAVDESTEAEYLGPAPDGFEMLEDPFESSSKKEQETADSDQKTVEKFNKMENAATDLPVVETVETVVQEDTQVPPMPSADNGAVESASTPSPVHKKGILGQIEAENEEQEDKAET